MEFLNKNWYFTTVWRQGIFKEGKKGLKNSIKTHKRGRLAWKSSVTLRSFWKGKRFWPYFQHLDKNFLSLIWETQKMQIQKKWHKDFTFFHEKKWWNENAVLQQQFTGNKSVWVLSEVQLCTLCYSSIFLGEKSFSKKQKIH